MKSNDIFYFLTLYKRWKYQEVELKLLPALQIPDGEPFLIRWGEKDGFEHLMFKICIISHLMKAGFNNDEMFLEYTKEFEREKYRADVYAKKKLGEKELWFECKNTEIEKLKTLRKLLNCRIIWVIEAKKLQKLWNCEGFEDKNIIKKRRQEIFPIGVEVWGVLEGRRVVLAMQRDGEDSYTFFNIPNEGWSLSQWGYIRKKEDKILPFKI
jgi:hypothetical protein